MKIIGVYCLVFVGLCLAGCGGGDSITRSSVSGKVTMNGEPVESGFVLFIPEQGVEGAPVQLEIAAGQYDSASDPRDDRGVAVGLNRVEIMGYRMTGKQVKNVMGEMEDEVLQIVPPKYNTASELKQEIVTGSQTIDFELTN